MSNYRQVWISLLKDANGQNSIVDGKYHLKEFLGSGGEGAVYRADEVILDEPVRSVAVKLHLKEDDNLEQQKREIKIILNISHPHLIRCFTAGQCKLKDYELVYLVMELGDAKTLDKCLPLSEEETREVVQSIGSVLVYLQDQNIVHRDVKPANVLRVDEQWKLSDFGLLREDVQSQGVLTRTFRGTPGYAPPEFYEGKVFQACDVWSLGAMIVEILTGNPAFSGKTTEHLKTLVIRAEPQLTQSLPAPFDEIVRGCLIKDPNERWTAKQVLEALNKPAISLSRPQPRPRIPPPIIRQSRTNVDDFDNLRNLLKAKKWEKADQETFHTMLKIAGREEEGKLTIECLENLPIEALCTIDKLWKEASAGKFGFSVQKHIWQEISAITTTPFRVSYEFGDRVGWYFDNTKWLGYHALNFDINAPQGHLPSWYHSELWTGRGMSKGVPVRVGNCARSLFSRLP
ncbi:MULTISPECIES: serine/threonine-protein kinase [unclassified Microcoleus]|uniref:serine/threonine-protein kinase n=1 Tax=unclassified Microcoleus TaxID=2642155 RepID=UPI002FD767A1